MKHLYEKNKVRHFLIWLAAYLVLGIVPINIGARLGVSDHAAAAGPLLVLAVVMLVYLRRTRIATDIGLGVPAAVPPSRMWFYLPLVVLVGLPLAGGISAGLTAMSVLGIIVHFVAAGLLEEVLFRGLLLRALLEKWPPAAAVLLSAVTFGVGHATSLLIGQSGQDTALQIINATVVGLIFTLVVLVTGSLTAVIAIHALYNTTAALAGAHEGPSIIVPGLIALGIFGAWLLFGEGAWRRLRGAGKSAPGSSALPGSQRAAGKH